MASSSALLLVVVLLHSLLVYCFSPISNAQRLDDAPLVPIMFFVESKCPYFQEYILDFQRTVVQAPGVAAIIEVSMSYIAQVDSSQPSGFWSQHGQSEVQTVIESTQHNLFHLLPLPSGLR
jgi:hypothetical protein